MKIICDTHGVSLVTVRECDAQFILDLRTDDDLGKHLSKTTNNVNDQMKWITEYQERERRKKEFYFIIKLREESVGTIRIYDINYNEKVFTWGSWIIKRNISKAPGNPRVSILSSYMIYYYMFDILNFAQSVFDVRKDNTSVYNFHKGYGSEDIDQDDLNYYLMLSQANYINVFCKKYHKYLKDISVSITP